MNHRNPSPSEPSAGCACPACRQQFSAFESYGIPPRRGRCPICAAKPRHRALLWFFRRHIAPRLSAGGWVLEIGPGKFQTRFLAHADYVGAARYLAIDVRHLRHHAKLEAPHQFVHASALAMPFPDACFDVIICNNTLPFIEQDQLALREIARCLRPDGVAMLQSHMGEEPTTTAARHAARHPELPEEWYAENAHFWVYGPDYPARIEAAGFDTARTMRLLDGREAGFRDRFGLKPFERVVLGFASDEGIHRFVAPDPELPPAEPPWLSGFWS